MDSKDAEKLLCPFRFGRPSEESQIGELKSVTYEDQHCITFKCMAWELKEINARFQENKPLDKENIVVSDQGYCALIRQEAVDISIMPFMSKTRAM